MLVQRGAALRRDGKVIMCHCKVSVDDDEFQSHITLTIKSENG